MTKPQPFDIPIFHKVYDLYKFVHCLQQLIPKSQRYTLWQKCENNILVLLEDVVSIRNVQANKRYPHLLRMSSGVDFLKVLIRLAEETKSINQKNSLQIQSSLQEIGKMIGGWIKFVPPS